MDTAGRKTDCLAVAATVHVLVITIEIPVPRVRRRVLRRRPEVGAGSETVEIAIVEPVAARKGSESAAVRSTGIWR